jgi:hypothetical protein
MGTETDSFNTSTGMNVNNWPSVLLSIKVSTIFLTGVKGKGCPCACCEGLYSEDVWFHSFLTSTPDAGEWSTSRPGHCTAGERPPPNAHGIG